jgi:hypothetical protein
MNKSANQFLINIPELYITFLFLSTQQTSFPFRQKLQLASDWLLASLVGSLKVNRPHFRIYRNLALIPILSQMTQSI